MSCSEGLHFSAFIFFAYALVMQMYLAQNAFAIENSANDMLLWSNNNTQNAAVAPRSSTNVILTQKCKRIVNIHSCFKINCFFMQSDMKRLGAILIFLCTAFGAQCGM